jgi:hypothetical protein
MTLNSSSRTTRTQSRHTASRVTLGIESLEDRTVPSASI